MTKRQNGRRTKIEHEAEGYLELGMPEHALQALGRLGDPVSFDCRALYLWGEGLRAMDRCFEALMPLERAAKAAPNDIHVRVALGWCYKRTGRLDLAIYSLEQALIVEPDEALLRYNLACYLSLSGQKRRALRYLSQALALDPAYRGLVESESDFNAMRTDPDFQSLCMGPGADSPSKNSGV
jgi:tetratricopeptide (TPR) repeat protein